MGFTQIVFRHMAHSAGIGERIRELSGALHQRFPKMERCRAAVEEFRAPSKSRQFKVTLDVRFAGATLGASAHGPDLDRVVREAFAQLEARLQPGDAHPRAA